MEDINMLEIVRKIDENDVDIWKKQIINHAKEYVKKHRFFSYKDAILTLLKIMEETRNKEISDEELGQLQVALVLLLCVRDSDKEGKTEKRELKWLDSLMYYEEETLWLRRYLYKRQKFSLRRTQQNITICPVEENEICSAEKTEFTDRLEVVLNNYTQFFRKGVSKIFKIPKKIGKCRLADLVLSDYAVYPILPAVLSSDIIQLNVYRKSPAKSKLVNPHLELPEWDEPINKYKILHKKSRLLCADIAEFLAMHLRTVSIPLSRIADSPTGFLEAVQEEFVVPRCRTVNLAQDLIAFYDLGMNDGQLLRNKISSYIEWPKKYTREVIEARFAEHGRELAEVIDFVRRMLSAKIWYDTSTMKVRYWHDILFSKLIDDKGLIKQGTACDFFGVDARSNRMKEADRIFERYFETVRIIYNVVEDTLPDAMSGRVQNNIANDFIIRFNKTMETQYWEMEALCGQMDEVDDVIKRAEDMPRQLQKALEGPLTVQVAYDFVKEHITHAPNSKECMEERAQKYYPEKEKRYELLRYYAEHMPDAWVAIYQFLLARSFDVIGHYAVAMLRHCAIRQCQIELEKEIKDIDADVQRIKRQIAAKQKEASLAEAKSTSAKEKE
ncbi:hypothetical protein [Agathobaculum hominis]|uniref:Uncharacterized protein n=1 Tax=Agathobaculum hominis TaxID=2763014 RepID=A0ABR7GQL6_9FIRM|nr:hypothetical protein [Agathobaculum hominis]MBC5696616.1 hypothetical protein [Agathobaculum hominis]